MKKLAVSSMIVLLCVSGCGQEKPVEKGRMEPISLQAVVPSSDQSFFVSEKDQFHSGSVLESVRKKKLVRTGLNPAFKPVHVENARAAWKIMNPKDAEFVKMEVLQYKSNPVIKPAFPFDYENDMAALKRLYRSHDLDKVCKKEGAELEIISALMEYTYDFMEGGRAPKPGEIPGPSAEVITSLRRDKGIGGTSREYAALFCQLALSCGYNARLVGMHIVDESNTLLTHDVCEVYLSDYNKWAVFDVFSKATYYVRDKTPLSALELHNISINKHYNGISLKTHRGDIRDTVALREGVLKKYHYIYIWRMNNILGTSPKGGTISWEDLYRYHLVWEDAYSPVADGAFDRLPQFNSADGNTALDGVHYVTREKKDFDWTLGQVEFALERTVSEYFILHLNTLTPNFEKFVADNGSSVEYIDQYTVKVGYMLGSLSFRTMNAFGVTGPRSYINFPG